MMYMVRHVTQLPVTVSTIANAEGMPAEDLSKVLRQLASAGCIRSTHGAKRGYVFARPPEEISLLELFETLEGGPLFDDCPLRHCECGGTPTNCRIFQKWISAGRKMNQLFEETSIVNAARNHPEHRFDSPPQGTNLS
jgi:Rrf2 family protein